MRAGLGGCGRAGGFPARGDLPLRSAPAIEATPEKFIPASPEREAMDGE